MSVPLSLKFQVIHNRIQSACERVQRSPDSVSLIAVSKTVPIAVLEEAAAAGLLHFGENKAQELRMKASQLSHFSLNWHFIGHLQRNKIKDVLPWIQMLHSLDRFELADTLNARLEAENRCLPVLVQVNTSGEASKSGILPSESMSLLEHVASLPYLKLKGLMTIGRLNGNEQETRACFRRLVNIRDEAQSAGFGDLSELSMGMSGDFEWAIEEGATLIRVGSSLFGTRL